MVKLLVLRWCLKQLSDGEVLIARGIWFQICGAAEENALRHKFIFHSVNIEKRMSGFRLLLQSVVKQSQVC